MNHSFSVDVAVAHGLHAAILHETIRFWVAKNKANGKHFHDGRFWTYNSARAFSELFPYLSADQIQRALKRLEDAGMIVTGCYNASPYDRTRWYSCAEGTAQDRATDSADLRNGSAPARNEIPQQRGTNTSSYQVQTAVQEPVKARKRADHLRPDDVPEQVWSDFMAMRKAKRAAVTETAVKLLRAEAAKAGVTLTAVLETCCANGWQGFKAEWLQRQQQTGRAIRPMADPAAEQARRDRSTAEAAEMLFGPGSGLAFGGDVIEGEVLR